MKREIKKEVVNTFEGEIEKTFIYTYDETKYKSLEEAIHDHRIIENEKKRICDELTDSNKIETDLANENFKIEFDKWVNSGKKGKQPEYKKPNLKWIDLTPFRGRGIILKEIYQENNDAEIDIDKLSEPQLQKLAQRLKKYLI